MHTPLVNTSTTLVGGASVKITFYAHASFRLEADGLVVVTDPYTPGPKPGSGFDPIDEPADIVIISSSTDDFHSGRPEEVAAMCVFLCSPAARYINGADLIADGGLFLDRWTPMFDPERG